MGLDELLGLFPFLLHRDYGDSPGLFWLLFELGFWAVVILLTLLLFRIRPRVLAQCESLISRTSKHEKFWLAGFGLAVILFRLALLPVIPVPVPSVHDEFSYLVGSDTFAQGRLTNPSTPMWEHFETFHVNMQPTYQSMYPPAQGMAMAIGQKLTGNPWAGVVLSTALMCAAMYWMLLGWLPPQWAWVGGAFCVIRFGLVSYWINSYMGGSVAALGGALLLGALPRLRREIKTSTALALVFGLLILANSRPLEGLVFSIPICCAVLWSLVKSEIPTGVKLRRLGPAVSILVLGLAWIPYFNWRGTGNPLLMPYVLNFREYHITTPYLFEKPHPIPEYHHQEMKTLYVFHEYPDLVRPRLEGIGYILDRTACRYYAFYLWPFLLLIVASLPALFREKELRVVLIALGLLAVVMLTQRWQPEAHYAAPAAGALIMLIFYALRRFRNFYGAYTIYASRAVVFAFAILIISSLANRIRDPFFLRPVISDPKAAALFARQVGMPSSIQRERVEADLDRIPGKQLLIVHYPYHDLPTTDWVYNKADLDNAHILWARDMGYLKNQELLNYYRDRQVWYVDRGDPSARIVPYREISEPWELALQKTDTAPSVQAENMHRADQSGSEKNTAAHSATDIWPKRLEQPTPRTTLVPAGVQVN